LGSINSTRNSEAAGGKYKRTLDEQKWQEEYAAQEDHPVKVGWLSMTQPATWDVILQPKTRREVEFEMNKRKLSSAG
jgi:hypothetical protein